MRMILRKLAFYVVTAIAAVTVDFFIPHAMPGNPVESVLARMQGTFTPAAIRGLEAAYGVNTQQSLWGQYFSFWGRLLHGNLGIATLISFGLGTLLGVLVAWRRGTWLDNLLPATTFLQAAPYFFVAFLALQLFSATLGWFPSVGAYSQAAEFPGWNLTYIVDVLHHAVLPALTIVACSVAGWIVGTRNVMLTTMDEDYVLIAQAKGLPKRRVIWYAARNAVLPSVSGFSLAIGFVVSGALLTEIVFSYPGLGFILLQGVNERDYPLLQGIFLVITFAVLAANLLADCVYIFLDPRIRQEA